MSIEALYTDSGKFYRTPQGLVVSAGRIISSLTGETFDHVPLDTLKMAELEGTGAHRIGCDAALKQMGHLDTVTIPSMPCDYPGDKDRWERCMIQVYNDLSPWIAKHEVEFVAVEEPSANYLYGFAGQPDFKAWWKPKPICKRRIMIGDYKRVAGVSEGHRLKLMLYRTLEGYKDCQDSVIIWIKKTGGIENLPVERSATDEAGLLGMASAIRWQLMKGYIKP